MYRKVLIPLDKSKEAAEVFPRIKDQLSPDTEVLLLHVIPPGQNQEIGNQMVPAIEQEDAQRLEALSYLRGITREYSDGASAGPVCREEVIVHKSVPAAIVECAENEGVDVVAMYTHDRKGLAALINRSVAQSVRKKAPIEVLVFKPEELQAA